MANENFLPRVNVTLNDLGLKIAPPPAGPKVTLLGVTSNTGVPVREAMTVSSVEKAINALYFSGNGQTFPGELALAVEEAAIAGAPNIEVMVIGTYSDAYLTGNYIHPVGNHTGRFKDLSGAYDVLLNREVNVVVPVGVYIDETGAGGSQNFGKQLADFCYQATTEHNSAVGVIPVAPVVWWAVHQDGLRTTGPTGTFANTNPSVSGEVAGYTDSTMFQDIYFGTPSSDLVNIWYSYHNGTGNYSAGFSGTKTTEYTNFQLGSYDSNNARFASAANSSLVNTAYFTSWQARDTAGALAIDSRGIKVDAGIYVNVAVAAPIRQTSTQVTSLASFWGADLSNTAYNGNGAAGYAGLMTSLAPHSATTNKFLPGVYALKPLSRTQANNLVGQRLVTMYTRTKGFVVAKDVTGAHAVNRYVRSDYVLLTTVRIVQNVVDGIRAIAEKYIGEPNNAPQLNSMNNEIDQMLLSMKGSALNGYDFTIQATPEQRSLGELDINLTLVPAFEITTINLVVSLASSI